MSVKNKKISRLSARDNYTEEDIRSAIDAIKLGLSIRAAGKMFEIPESTLRNKYKGARPISMKMGPPTLLTDAEEEVIMNFIRGSRQRAHPATKSNVLQAVTAILEEEMQKSFPRRLPPSFKGTQPKEKWWILFCKRHPNFTLRTPESLTTARKNMSVSVIKQWFSDVEQYFTEVGALDALMDPSRNFNIDESGFSLSPEQGRVLPEKGDKLVFEETSRFQKTNITVLGNICADGRIPPPMIIYPRKRINPMMAEEFPTNFEFTVGKSNNGYITYETLFEFLCNGFNDWLTSNNVIRPVIVWTDWHETKNNCHLAKTLNSQNIILYGLPPNTTHFMQPLDISVFGPLKKGWSKEAKDWELRNPDKVINQINFAQIFMPTYYKYLKEENIKSGFSKCGIMPFNPDSPDYSKLEAAAAQKESGSFVFVGVDQGEYIEMSTQTARPPLLSKGTQTDVIYSGTTVTERLDDFIIKEEPEWAESQLDNPPQLESDFIKCERADSPSTHSQVVESPPLQNNYIKSEMDMSPLNYSPECGNISSKSGIEAIFISPLLPTKYEGSEEDFSNDQTSSDPVEFPMIEGMKKKNFDGSTAIVISKVKAIENLLTTQITDATFTCKMCNFTATIQTDIGVHEKSHEVVNRFICEVCTFNTSRKSDLKRHNLVHSGEKNYSCESCNYRTKEKSKLNRHVKIHSTNRPFACTTCPFRTSDTVRLNKHIMEHNGLKPFQCEICPFSTNRKNHMTRHNVIHTGEKPFLCEICPYRTNERSSLNRHLRIHKGIKPYGCSKCGFHTIDKSRLNKHMMTHTGEKPFPCTVCSFRTNDKSILKRHTFIHTGKPYSCELCSIKTSDKSNLKIHMATHTGEKPFACEICSYRSSTKLGIKRHNLIHTGEKPFPCDFCSFRTNISSNLKRHITSHHLAQKLLSTEMITDITENT